MAESAKLRTKAPEAKRENTVSQTREPERSKSMDSPIDRILFLQRTVGNQAVQEMIQSGVIQAKLTIGQPGDMYEQEADRVADLVMSMPEPKVQRQTEEEKKEEELIQPKPLFEQITPLVQRQIEEEEEEETVQPKFFSAESPTLQRQEDEEEKEEELVQPKAENSQSREVTPDLESRIHALKGGGQPLPESARAFFEPRFGRNFSKVRVYTGSKAVETSRSLNAYAFTVGRDIVFGSGQYEPKTLQGKKLLAHELTHVVQQDQCNRFGIQQESIMIKPTKVESSKEGEEENKQKVEKRILSTKLEFYYLNIRKLLAEKDYDNMVDMNLEQMEEYLTLRLRGIDEEHAEEIAKVEQGRRLYYLKLYEFEKFSGVPRVKELVKKAKILDEKEGGKYLNKSLKHRELSQAVGEKGAILVTDGYTGDKRVNANIYFKWDRPKRWEKRLKDDLLNPKMPNSSLQDIREFVEEHMAKHGFWLKHDKLKVNVIGYASVEGTKKYNKNLAARRNEIILQWLKSEKFEYGKVEKNEAISIGEIPERKEKDVREEDRRVNLELMFDKFVLLMVCHEDGRILVQIDGRRIIDASGVSQDIRSFPPDLLLLMYRKLKKLLELAKKEELEKYSGFTDYGKKHYKQTFQELENLVVMALESHGIKP